MISIRKHLDRITGEDRQRRAFLALTDQLFLVLRQRIPVADTAGHSQFCESLRSLQKRLEEDSNPSGIEVVSALLSKTLTDYWGQLANQIRDREQELKRIIHLLTEGAARLDAENKQFYIDLRSAVQDFESISQLEDIVYLRRKLGEQIGQVRDSVRRQEAASASTISGLQAELKQARRQIVTLTRDVAAELLARLPARPAAEGLLRELSQNGQLTTAVLVLERLDLISQRYGADHADEALIHFARQLREKLPPAIVLAWWTGPAFLGVAPKSPASDVRLLLQSILAEIAADPIEVRSKGVGLIRLTARSAVRQWDRPEAEAIIRTIEKFSAAPEAAEPPGDKVPPLV